MLGPELDGGTKYCGGGVLALGRKIYFAPVCASHVLCIDPETHTAWMLGPELDGLYKCMGGSTLEQSKLKDRAGILLTPCSVEQAFC